VVINIMILEDKFGFKVTYLWSKKRKYSFHFSKYYFNFTTRE